MGELSGLSGGKADESLEGKGERKKNLGLLRPLRWKGVS